MKTPEQRGNQASTRADTSLLHGDETMAGTPAPDTNEGDDQPQEADEQPERQGTDEMSEEAMRDGGIE